MTVTSYTGSRAARGADRFVSMRRDLDALQRQLATGVRSQTYGGLGFGRQTSLDARGRLSAIEGYDAAIKDASLRLKVMTQGLEQLAAAARDTRTESLPPQFKIDTEGRTSLQKNAAQRLMLAVDVLNTDVNGRRLFGGRAVDSAPVEVPDRLLNGDPNAGLAG